MQFTSRLLAERSQVPSRQTITEQEYRLRCYVRPDSLAAVCVTDQEYEDRVSFTMLSKVLDEFSQAVPASSWPTLQEKDCNFNKLRKFLIQLNVCITAVYLTTFSLNLLKVII
jgi:synaptobrevin family protein YKT6